MGTTGTIMGTSRYLKEQNPAVQIVGVTPAEGSAIPGIRRWPEAYVITSYSIHYTKLYEQACREVKTLMRAALGRYLGARPLRTREVLRQLTLLAPGDGGRSPHITETHSAV